MDKTVITAWIINKERVFLAAIKGAIVQAKNNYGLLAINQKLYIRAATVLLFYLLFPKAIDANLEKSLLHLFFLFWLWAIGYDLLTIYKKIYKTLLGKGFLILLLTIFTNIALALSGQVVNDITQVNPGNFPHTQTVLAILMIPMLVIVLGAFLYFVMLIFSPLLLIFHISDNDFKRFFIPWYSASTEIKYLKITRAVQTTSIIIFFGLIYSLSHKIDEKYTVFVSNSARFLLYNFEMYSKAPCVIENGVKIAFIEEDKILVARRNKEGNTTFKLAECKTTL
jgi:hypothetical protein